MVQPRAKPWDDAFIEIAGAPHVRWPGILDIELTSSAGATGREPSIAEPGHPITMTMAWRWRRLDETPGRPG